MFKNKTIVIAGVAASLGLAFCSPSSKSKTPMEQTNREAQSAQSSVIKPGAQPVLVSSQFSFTEGPTADKDGNVFFTDQPNNRIWKWSPSEGLSLFLEPAGRSNGMFFSRTGALLSCADDQNEVWSIAPDKKVTVLLSQVGGKKLNGPNDIFEDAQGGIYFTDPYYQRDYWTRKKPDLEGEYLYYLPKGATQPIIADSTLVKPNGLVGTPDGRYLYVADIRGNKTYRFEVAGPGRLQNRTLFTEMGSDGVTIDQQGNLYLTGKGVTIFNPEGKQIGHIPIDEGWTANLCFAGKDRNILFITASKSVYTVDMAVKGVW